MDVGRAWEIIEGVLSNALPEVAATLRPPVSDGDLDRLATATGHDLPESLVASLRIHDGQDNPTRLLGLLNAQTLLSAGAMIDDLEMRGDALGDDLDADDYAWMVPEKVRAIPNCRGWLRFTDVEGDGWALDLDPLPAGSVGQIIWLPIDGPTPAPEAASYETWFSGIAEGLEAGAYRIDSISGLWLESWPRSS